MIELVGVRYVPDGVRIIDGLDLSVTLARATAFVGPSGCGKSTLLRLIAGLRSADGGSVLGVPERKAFVFQDAALLPWLDTRENVALPGRFGPIGDVDAAIAAVGLLDQASQLPGTLSGGQRMRASIARALVSRPEIVFLDEAFSALDGVTRNSVQDLFFALQLEHSWTVLLVTHELEDAARRADRVIALAGPPLTVRGDFEPVRTEAGAIELAAQLHGLYT